MGRRVKASDRDKPWCHAERAMARGHALEPQARQRYASETRRDVQPACPQSTRFEWLRASVDGLSAARDAVVEIKCGDAAYRTTMRTGAPPSYYRAQLQHILAVTGLAVIDFFCYWPGTRPVLVPVACDERYIERLLEAEAAFVLQMRAPSPRVRR